MGLFKKKDAPSNLKPGPEEESLPPAEDRPGDAEPTGGKKNPPPAEASSAAAGEIDYSNEDVLLAMVKSYVADQSPPAAETGDKHSPAPETADAYPASAAGSSSPGDEAAHLLNDLPPAPEDEELEKLRRLVLSREIAAIENIHRQLNDTELRAEALSQVITEALRLRVLKDDELIGVLKPTVENIVSNSVRNNPKELADNLFPVIGPAIRRSISESIRGMLQDFSRTLEKSFSLTGLKWRLEAIRTGRDFSEVVMLKTLEHQIEQVLVIHVDTGVPLVHLVNQDARDEVKEKAKDADQVAAMLSVIQQFVSDSFAHGELTTVDFGDRNIFLARAPQLILACVVWGQAPSNLRIDMQTALELMVMDCADELANFSGDDHPFAKAAHHFEALLVSRYKDENQKLSFRAKLLPLTLLAVIAFGLGVWLYARHDQNRLEIMAYDTISGPGLVPLRISPSLFNKWEIVCLKDELAKNPEEELIAGGLEPDRFSIRYLPYVSQDGPIVEKRLQPLLSDKPENLEYVYDHQSGVLTLSGQAPITWLLSSYERLLAVPGVSAVKVDGLADPSNQVAVQFDDKGVAHLSGAASVAWRENVKERILALPGISGVDLSQVSDDQATARIRELVEAINSTVLYFPLNKDVPLPADDQKLNEAVRQMVELERRAARMDLAVSLVIYGHADATGVEKHNYELSQARAKTVAAKLYAAGSSIPVSTYGMGADFADKQPTDQKKPAESQASRKIELRVHLNRRGTSVALD